MLQPEPAPPAGVGAGALLSALQDALGPERGEAVYRWMLVEMPEWGREGWRRAEELSAEFLRRERAASENR
jgi:hypothetical protein